MRMAFLLILLEHTFEESELLIRAKPNQTQVQDGVETSVFKRIMSVGVRPRLVILVRGDV